jgi:hypothetical protein
MRETAREFTVSTRQLHEVCTLLAYSKEGKLSERMITMILVKKGKLLLLVTMLCVAGSLTPSARAARGVSMGHASVHVSSGSSHVHYGRGWGYARGRGWGGGYYDYEYSNPYAWGSGAYPAMTTNSLDMYNREHDAQMSQMPAAATIRTYTWPSSSPDPYGYSAGPAGALPPAAMNPAGVAKTCQINPVSRTRVASKL